MNLLFTFFITADAGGHYNAAVFCRHIDIITGFNVGTIALNGTFSADQAYIFFSHNAATGAFAAVVNIAFGGNVRVITCRNKGVFVIHRRGIDIDVLFSMNDGRTAGFFGTGRHRFNGRVSQIDKRH